MSSHPCPSAHLISEISKLDSDDFTPSEVSLIISTVKAKASKQIRPPHDDAPLLHQVSDILERQFERRRSMAGSDNEEMRRANLEDMKEALVKLKGWENASLEDVEEAGEQFLAVIINSGWDIDTDVGVWFDKSYPTEGLSDAAREKVKRFLVVIARKNRKLAKMSRYGVAVKMLFTLFMGYFDIITDLLVAKSYYDVEDYKTAYATAAFAIFAIVAQALFTFFQYGRRSICERFWRTLLALCGIAPLMEGANVWMGTNDQGLLISPSAMYATMKAGEICFESIPESIIQIGGLLRADQQHVQMIQIVGVVSSILSGAFIMTDGNFGLMLSMHIENPGEPYYAWISKKLWEKRRQMFGTFLFNACYFSQFVFVTSLFAAFNSRRLVGLLSVELGLIFAYMGWKGELFGFSVLSHPSAFNNYVFPFIAWSFYYLLVCAAPMSIAACPMELGPEIFSTLIVWRLLTNGGFIYLALDELEESHYLDRGIGMQAYVASMLLAAFGLFLFIRNCDENFDRKLYLKPKSGKEHARECWKDEKPWIKGHLDKDDDVWAWVGGIHPTYLPFDMVTVWICEKLVGKYGEFGPLLPAPMERPKWMTGEEEEKFIMRIVALYEWHGKDIEEVNRALKKLFGRDGDDLELGIKGQLTFIKKKDEEKQRSFMNITRSAKSKLSRNFERRSTRSKIRSSRVEPA
ncbi:hypothetical protein TrLO_g8526 [Triparma laevis f. longispina]|uniref:Uncharacterized protein n=1 Tax=Triparma laevis f. longispina TaxID=1714387 RepID=A0A9W7F6F3_9STRA|nr:hypothetical protein TrLO_g8526 [Triparma laevis f. longispina]